MCSMCNHSMKFDNQYHMKVIGKQQRPDGTFQDIIAPNHPKNLDRSEINLLSSPINLFVVCIILGCIMLLSCNI